MSETELARGASTRGVHRRWSQREEEPHVASMRQKVQLTYSRKRVRAQTRAEGVRAKKCENVHTVKQTAKHQKRGNCSHTQVSHVAVGTKLAVANEHAEMLLTSPTRVAKSELKEFTQN